MRSDDGILKFPPFITLAWNFNPFRNQYDNYQHRKTSKCRLQKLISRTCPHHFTLPRLSAWKFVYIRHSQRPENFSHARRARYQIWDNTCRYLEECAKGRLVFEDQSYVLHPFSGVTWSNPLPSHFLVNLKSHIRNAQRFWEQRNWKFQQQMAVFLR
jgi:hypothetical protein